MNGGAKMRALVLATVLASTIGSTFAGAFAISAQRHEKAKISRHIAACEVRIKQLRRENEELSVKIAELENPMWLSKRVGAKMSLPKANGSVVWAYENFDGGRVEFAGTSGNTLSFKPGTEKQ